MTTATAKETTVTIEKVSSVEGRDGPQWELQVRWPWTSADFADKTWLMKSAFDEPQSGAYNVVVEHNYLKNKREGGKHDGSKEFMWSWRILEFLNRAPRVDTMPEPVSAMNHEPYDNEEPERPLTAHDVVHGKPNLYPQPEGVVKGHVENIAVRLYLAYRTNQTIYDEPDLYAIRLLRDRVYHQLTNLPIQPPHWCYIHEQQHNGNDAGVYGHRDGEGWCMEAQDGPETNGEPTQED